MLVFDGRYLVAIVPVLIAICCPLLLFLIWPHARHTYHRGCRRPGSDCSPRALSFSRSTGRLLFEQWTVISKPVATSRRCPSRRRAGGNAGQHRRWPLSGARCGIRSRAVFGVPCGMAAVGGNSELPPASDAVVVWGSLADPAYGPIFDKVKLAQELPSATSFTDPYKGEVGTVLLFRRTN